VSKRRVVLTGAAGRIAELLLPALQERYDLVLLDARAIDPQGAPLPDVHTVDLIDPNRDVYRHYFAGVDAVIHCAYLRENVEDQTVRFAEELANVQMAFNVYQTAWEERVRRVVMTSSNNAANFQKQLFLQKRLHRFGPDLQPRAISYYGWSKIAYEGLGFVFALGEAHGRPLENVQIRIGHPREYDVARCPLGDLACVRMALTNYISQRDLVQLYVNSIETADIRDANGVPFQVFYGISDNPHALWSIANARQVIGYTPQDNAWLRFHDEVGRHVRAARERQNGA
jgi:hypothetical protein